MSQLRNALKMRKVWNPPSSTSSLLARITMELKLLQWFFSRCPGVDSIEPQTTCRQVKYQNNWAEFRVRHGTAVVNLNLTRFLFLCLARMLNESRIRTHVPKNQVQLSANPHNQRAYRRFFHQPTSIVTSYSWKLQVTSSSSNRSTTPK